MNHVVLIGRMVNDIEIVEEKNSKKIYITLAVQRSFKNSDGIYETDLFRCVLWAGISEKLEECCKKGDILCIRGRLQTRNYIDEQGESKYLTEVVAEKISFVSNCKTERDEIKNE